MYFLHIPKTAGTALREVVEKLQVYPERMEQNLALTKGLYFSQSILLALTRAGVERKNAYEAVQRAALGTNRHRQRIRPRPLARLQAGGARFDGRSGGYSC